MTVSRRTFLAGLGATAFTALACGNGAGDESGDAAAASDGTTAPTTATVPSVPRSAAFVSQGPTDSGEVALTFHTDGDLGIADELLAVLAEREVVVTSFVVGEWLEANPGYATLLTDAGHELANHTYSHPSDFTTLDADAMAAEILGCRDVITELTGSAGTLFRPSGTPDGTVVPPPLVLAESGVNGYPTVLGFDVDPYDYQDPGSSAVVERTLAAAQPGSIISLHFGHAGTVEAMPTILDGLDDQGLTPVTASALLAP